MLPDLTLDLTRTRIVSHPDRRKVAWVQADQRCCATGVQIAEPDAIALNDGRIFSVGAALLWGQPEIARLWRQETQASRRGPGGWISGMSLGALHRPFARDTRARSLCPPEDLYGPTLQTALALRIFSAWIVWRLAQTSSIKEAQECNNGMVWHAAQFILCPDPMSPRWHVVGGGELPLTTQDYYPMPLRPERQHWLTTPGRTNIGAGIWLPSLTGADGMEIRFSRPETRFIGLTSDFYQGPWDEHPNIRPAQREVINSALQWFGEEDRSEFLLFGAQAPWTMPEPSTEP